MAMMMMLAGAESYAGAVAARPALSSVSMTAIRPGDIGTTKPLGIYDPLNLMTTMPDKYRRCAPAAATYNKRQPLQLQLFPAAVARAR